MKLLYRVAEWHAFAKMRLHTETTLKHLEDLMTELGKLMRDFEHSICSKFQTFELPREVEARKRQEAARRLELRVDPLPALSAGGKRTKTFNLFTYKWHALGDYVTAIRLFGGTDGFSSQLVSDELNVLEIVSLLITVTGGTLPPTSETAVQTYQQTQCSEADRNTSSPLRTSANRFPSTETPGEAVWIAIQ